MILNIPSHTPVPGKGTKKEILTEAESLPWLEQAQVQTEIL